MESWEKCPCMFSSALPRQQTHLRSIHLKKTSRSQPDLTLVGVRSVLSPRPYSAPQPSKERDLIIRPLSVGSDDYEFSVLSESLKNSDGSCSVLIRHKNRDESYGKVIGETLKNSEDSCSTFSHPKNRERSYEKTNNWEESYGGQEFGETTVRTDIIKLSEKNIELTENRKHLEDLSHDNFNKSGSDLRLTTQGSKDSALGSSVDGVSKDINAQHRILSLDSQSSLIISSTEREHQRSRYSNKLRIPYKTQIITMNDISDCKYNYAKKGRSAIKDSRSDNDTTAIFRGTSNEKTEFEAVVKTPKSQSSTNQNTSLFNVTRVHNQNINSEDNTNSEFGDNQQDIRSSLCQDENIKCISKTITQQNRQYVKSSYIPQDQKVKPENEQAHNDENGLQDTKHYETLQDTSFLSQDGNSSVVENKLPETELVQKSSVKNLQETELVQKSSFENLQETERVQKSSGENLQETERVEKSSGENLQDEVDLRLAEAQRSGHLDLSNLGLPFFPSAVLLADGSMIHRISLQDNRLVDLPGASLCLMTALTWLDLRYNQLTCLSCHIGKLNTLQVLLLQGNNLTTLPTTLGLLSELVTLQVSDNPLTFPPKLVIRQGTKAILAYLRDKLPDDSQLNNYLGFNEIGAFVNNDGSSLYSGEHEESEDEVRDDGDCKRDDINGEEFCSGGENVNNPESGESSASSPVLSTGLSVAIRNFDDTSMVPRLENYQTDISYQNPDSGRDTIGHPQSPTSPCLLTPNTEFPSRPEYDWEALGNTRDLYFSPEKNAYCNCENEHKTRGNTRALDFSSEKFTYNCENDYKTRGNTRALEFDSEKNAYCNTCENYHKNQNCLPKLNPFEAADSWNYSDGFDGPRCRLHLRLRGSSTLEDDMESLEGDLGEGYRKQNNDALNHREENSHRAEVRSVSLPVVKLQLVGDDEQQKTWARQGRESGTRISRRRQRKPSSLPTRRKPKLVTVAEVHKRAREARRRQREVLAAAKEATQAQRLKSTAGLESWRDEARELQEKQHLFYTLHTDEYMPAVLEAPFAVDGTMLTPRAREKMKSREDHSSAPLSPTVSEVCAGVQSCLEELNHCAGDEEEGAEAAEKGAGKREGKERIKSVDERICVDGRGVGGSVAHSASVIHQLHILRKQLHRLRVNAVI